VIEAISEHRRAALMERLEPPAYTQAIAPTATEDAAGREPQTRGRVTLPPFLVILMLI
jgi:hypothetical protein